ncbi:hypothetical protein FACS1894132_02470 [Clostridia bacterium]|nr:hypothetical protein FACS1894132_02470 [Clostridia bacterium]
MFDTIKLEKSMYNLSNKSFSQRLEELDPSENYVGTAYEGLDSFERQLKRFDIKVAGPDCDKVEKFFTSSESAVLFPEFVKRTLSEAFNSEIVYDIFATTTKVKGINYNPPLMTSTSGWGSAVAQGATFAGATIMENTTPIPLEKYGATIKTSYEFLRCQNLDTFKVFLSTFGRNTGVSLLGNLIAKLTLAPTNPAHYEGTTLQYSDFLTLYGSSNHITSILIPTILVGAVTSMEEIKDCKINEKGRIVLPFGPEIVFVKSWTHNKILGIDRRCALELVKGSDIIVDTDKLIDTQMDALTYSVSANVNVLYPSRAIVMVPSA